jgi:hypothetical protein
MNFWKKFKIILFCFSFCFVFLPNFSFASIFNKTPKDSLKKGLVGWWSMDGKNTVWSSATAGTVTDLSGNGFTGTLSSMNIATSTTQGKIGQAIRFSRGGTQITAADNSSFTFSNGTNDLPFTFSVWIKRDNIGNNHTILSKTGVLAALTPFEYVFNLDSSNKLVMTLYDTSGTNQISLTSNNSLETDVGKWVHYVVTYSGSGSASGLSFYRNAIALPGTTASAGSYVTMRNSTQLLRIGNAFSSDPANKAPMNGAIEDLRIFNRVLSSNEILNLYNQGSGSRVSVTPKGVVSSGLNAGLVGWWTFDGKDMLNGAALDKSGNGNTGNLVNIATTTFYVPGKLGQAFKLDGINDYVKIPNSVLFSFGAGDFSVSYWVYRSAPTLGWDNVWGVNQWRISGELTNSFSTGFTTDGANNLPQFGVRSNLGVEYNVNGTIPIVPGKWFHFTAVREGTYMKIFINGDVNVSSSVLPVNTVIQDGGSYEVRIGNSMLNFLYTAASYDDVRIYNRALSISEVSQLYNQGAGDKINATPKIIGSTGLNFGLLSWWTFDGKDMLNGAVLDKSGNGNTANLANIATTTFYTRGKIGQAFKFDGLNDNMTTTSDFIGTSPITFTAWLRPFSVTQIDGVNHFILSNGKVRIYGGTSNQIRVNSDGATNAISSSNLLVFGKWVFVAVTMDGSGVVNIYNNGVLSGSANQSAGSRSAGSTNVTIGALSGGATPFNGNIDDVRIYNRILSTQEILQIYNQGK